MMHWLSVVYDNGGYVLFPQFQLLPGYLHSFAHHFMCGYNHVKVCR